MFVKNWIEPFGRSGRVDAPLIVISAFMSAVLLLIVCQSEASASPLTRMAALASAGQQTEQGKPLLAGARRPMRPMRRMENRPRPMPQAERRQDSDRPEEWNGKKKKKRVLRKKKTQSANKPSSKIKRTVSKKKSTTIKAPSQIAADNGPTGQIAPPVPELAPVKKDPISASGVAAIGLAHGPNPNDPAATQNHNDNSDSIDGPFVELPGDEAPDGPGFEITGHRPNPNIPELNGNSGNNDHGNSQTQTDNWQPDSQETDGEPNTGRPGRQIVCLGGGVWSGRCRCGPDRDRFNVRPAVFICAPAGGTAAIPGLASSAEPSPAPDPEGPDNAPPAPAANRPAAPAAIAVSLPQSAPDEVLVAVAPGAPETVEEQISQSYGLELLERWPLEFFNIRLIRFRIPDGRAVPAVVASLQAEAQIESPQPNYYYLPNSEALGPSADAAVSDLQYALAKLDIGRARAMATGKGVLVAIIDSEIDTTHPDLAGALTEEFNAAAEGESQDSDHGTAIAGIIGARGMLRGVAPGPRLLGVNALTAVAKGESAATTMTLMRGLNWALGKKAGIVNLSLTGPEDGLLKQSIALAADEGAVIVAAAGNQGPGAPPVYPAAYKQVIAVTATDVKDTLYTAANRGSFIDIAAPGVDILTPSLGHAHLLQTGTSFAAAHVTGIVALMLERNPGLGLSDIRRILRNTAMDLGPVGYDEQFGAGNANAFAALMQIKPTISEDSDLGKLTSAPTHSFATVRRALSGE